MKKVLIFSFLIVQSLVLFSQERFTSPDGKKRVLINRTADGRYQVIVNSSAHKVYQQIVKQKIYFFGDSSTVAYIAKCDDGYCVVIDGVEQIHAKKKIYLDTIYFSPDQSRYAYIVLDYMGLFYAKAFYVIDGVKQPAYKSLLTNITFSPDSKHWAYATSYGDKWFYVIDGVKQTTYHNLNTKITFSPNSKHWAYAASNGNEWFYIIDGEEQPHYEQITAESIAFSSDSKHWSYGANKNNEWICILDGNEPPHDNSNLCSSYTLEKSLASSTEFDFFEFGLVNSHNYSSNSFRGEERSIGLTEGNGGVLLPELYNQNGFYVAYGYHSVNRFISGGAELSYTHLLPKSTWNDIDVKIKYFYFIDFNMKLSFLPVKSLSFDFLLGLNLMTRMKIEDGSFTYNNNGDITEIKDVKLKGGIIKGFPYNALCGFGISYKIAPKLIISANANTRYVVFKCASGAMGRNKEFIGFLSDPDYKGLGAWKDDPRLTFQISIRFLY